MDRMPSSFEEFIENGSHISDISELDFYKQGYSTLLLNHRKTSQVIFNNCINNFNN